MLCKIKRIIRKNGNAATDGESIRRIGRMGRILCLEVGRPMELWYEDTKGILVTSVVKKVRLREGKTLQVTTRNRVYYLELQEDKA